MSILIQINVVLVIICINYIREAFKKITILLLTFVNKRFTPHPSVSGWLKNLQ